MIITIIFHYRHYRHYHHHYHHHSNLHRSYFHYHHRHERHQQYLINHRHSHLHFSYCHLRLSYNNNRYLISLKHQNIHQELEIIFLGHKLKNQLERKSRVLEEIDEKILELPDSPKIQLGDASADAPETEAGQILQDKYLKSKEQKEKNLKNITEECSFDEIKMLLMRPPYPAQFNFFMGVRMMNLSRHVTFCH